MTIETEQVQGLHLTGEYRRAWQEEAREGTDANGNAKVYAGRFKVRLLVNDRTLDVEYRDEAAAADALGDAIERGDVVTLPVGVRAAKGYVFYYGRRERED